MCVCVCVCVATDLQKVTASCAKRGANCVQILRHPFWEVWLEIGQFRNSRPLRLIGSPKNPVNIHRYVGKNMRQNVRIGETERRGKLKREKGCPPKNSEELVYFRVAMEDWALVCHLGKYTSHAPHVNWTGIALRTEQNFGCTIPQCYHLSQQRNIKGSEC